MHELIEFEQHCDGIKTEAQQGDLVRLIGGSAVGWTLIAGTAASPLGLLGLGLGGGAVLWQVFAEAQKTNTKLRWIPSFQGYGWEFLSDALEENPRYEAIAQLYDQFGAAALKRYVASFPETDQPSAIARLVDIRTRLNTKLDTTKDDEEYDRVEAKGLEKLRSIVLGDEEGAIATPTISDPNDLPPEAPSAALDLFDWSELNRYPNRFPHLLLLGKTGAGKTTLAEKLLELLPGDRLVITPHHKPSDFPGVQVIGKGRDYTSILVGLQSLEKEMQARYERYARGEDDFTWLNVCIDEFPAIAANCGKDASEAMMILAREARKVKIRLIILSQGGEVKALGIEGNGSVRECFTFIRLRGFAEDHAKRLKDGAIAQTISNQPYPCMVEDTPADTSVLAALSNMSNPNGNKGSTSSQASQDLEAWIDDEGDEEDKIDDSFYIPQLPGVALSTEGQRLYGWLMRKQQLSPDGWTMRTLSRGKPLGRSHPHTAETLQPILSELLGQDLIKFNREEGIFTLD